MRRTEIVIVGGGPAGAATASGLAAAGRDVVLIERAGGPHHKVCGEFLSVETQAQLRAFGIDAGAHGAVAIDHVSVCSAARNFTVALPFRALSLSRYRLDDVLLRSAQTRGAQIKRGVVRGVTRGRDGWTVRCDNGEAMHCRRLVLATGKWGLRGVDDTRDRSRVGLKMHLRLMEKAHRALTGRVELCFLDGGYAGLELIEDGVANLCVLLPRALVARLGLSWSALHIYLAAALPSLDELLAGSQPLWDKPLAVVCPGGGHLHRDQGPVIYRVGDRLAHIPPFAGDGLAIALASAKLAVDHIHNDCSPGQYLAAARQLTSKPVRFAGLLSWLAARDAGRAALMGLAASAPGFLGMIVRHTRLALPEH